MSGIVKIKTRRETIMAGYVVVQVSIHDPEGFAVYREMVPPTLEVYGGRYLVRGGDWENLEAIGSRKDW